MGCYQQHGLLSTTWVVINNMGCYQQHGLLSTTWVAKKHNNQQHGLLYQELLAGCSTY
jgi:hypothetical protein